MSSPWLDDTDYESGEYDDSDAGEAYDDSDTEGEDFDAESRSAAARRRRARAQRVALARRRQAQAMTRARGRRGMPSRPPGQQAITAVRNLDLETKVQEDAFRTAINAQGARMSRSEYAAVAGVAANQIIESFDQPKNPYARAALRFAPLLLISPQKRGTGVEAFIKDPRVIGAAAVAGITIVGENRNRFSRARSIEVLAPTELTAGGEDKLVADVLDGNGRRIGEDVTWESDKKEVADVKSDGTVIAGVEGTARITATYDGVVRRIRVMVVPRPQGAQDPAPVKK